MTSTVLSIDGTWITDPVTGASMAARKSARGESDKRNVQVRTYAGGRRRIISTPQRTRSTALTLRLVADSDLETLRGWAGEILLLRDGQGWRRWGTFDGVQVSTVRPSPEAPVHDVALTWQDVDYVEGV